MATNTITRNAVKPVSTKRKSKPEQRKGISSPLHRRSRTRDSVHPQLLVL
jgi:hypothetical protein